MGTGAVLERTAADLWRGLAAQNPPGAPEATRSGGLFERVSADATPVGLGHDGAREQRLTVCEERRGKVPRMRVALIIMLALIGMP